MPKFTDQIHGEQVPEQLQIIGHIKSCRKWHHRTAEDIIIACTSKDPMPELQKVIHRVEEKHLARLTKLHSWNLVSREANARARTTIRNSCRNLLQELGNSDPGEAMREHALEWNTAITMVAILDALPHNQSSARKSINSLAESLLDEITIQTSRIIAAEGNSSHALSQIEQAIEDTFGMAQEQIQLNDAQLIKLHRLRAKIIKKTRTAIQEFKNTPMAESENQALKTVGTKVAIGFVSSVVKACWFEASTEKPEPVRNLARTSQPPVIGD